MTSSDSTQVKSATLRQTRRADAAACALLALAPLMWLWPALLAGATFVPFDIARFDPWSIDQTAEERTQLAGSPSNFDVTEVPVLVLPEIELAHAELEEGRFPGWNPYARFGAPLFANGLAALLHPVNRLTMLNREDPGQGLVWRAWIALAVAGLGCFSLLRALRLRTAAALFGGLAFAFGGQLTANLHFYMRADALVWQPIMLLGCLLVSRASNTWGRVPGTLLLAASTMMTWLSGFPPFAVVATLVCGVWAACLLGLRSVRTRELREVILDGAFLAAGVGLGIAMTGPQLLPMLAYFPESNRDLQPTADSLASQGYDPVGFLEMLLPHTFMTPTGEAQPTTSANPLVMRLYSRSSWGEGVPFWPPNLNFTEYALFPGALTFLLALVGITTRLRLAWAFTAMLATCLLLMPGMASLARVHMLPFIENIQPMRFSGPVGLLLAVLAACGLQRILDARAWRRGFAAAIAGALIATGVLTIAVAGLGFDRDTIYSDLLAQYREALQSEISLENVVSFFPEGAFDDATSRIRWSALLAFPRWLLLGAATLGGAVWMQRHPSWKFSAPAALCAFVLLVDLFWFGQRVASPRVLLDRSPTPIHQALFDARDRHAPTGGFSVIRAVHTDLPFSPEQLPPGTLFPHRIRDLNAYAFVDRHSSAVFRALYPGRMQREYWPLALPDDERLELPLFDLMGTRYVLTKHPPGRKEDLEHAGTPVVRFSGEGGRFVLHERTTALGRAFVVPTIRSMESEQELVDALTAPDLDPLTAVLTLPEDAELIGSGSVTADAAASERKVRFERDVPGHVVVEVEDGPEGFLVLNDAFLSGWEVSIDGAPATTARGNLWMRVLRIPKGAHTVEYRYTPPRLAAGYWVGRIAFLLLLGLTATWLTDLLRSRRQTRPTAIAP